MNLDNPGMKSRCIVTLSSLLVAFGLTLPSTTAGQESGSLTLTNGQNSDWSFDIKPYLWVASVNADTSLPTTPTSVSHFDTKISAAAMLVGQVHYKSFGVLLDFAWLRLDSDA